MSGRLGYGRRGSLWARLILLLVSLAALNLSASAVAPIQTPAAQQPPEISTLQGKLVVSGSGSRLATSSGDIKVTSDNPQLLRTLQDTRLAGREVRLEGQRTLDGEFKTSHILIVHDGRLFRLRYYCHVCNIPATEPGPCMCCQRPTELEEIPLGQVTKDMVLVP